MLAKVESKGMQSVITALIKQARKLAKKLYRSLTWDRGSEMAGHRKFTIATKIDVYFCDPQSSPSADCFALACRAMHDNAPATKIPTDFCANTSRKELIHRALVRPNSALLHASLTSGPEKPCNTKPQWRNLKPVLRRPIETKPGSGHCTVARTGQNGVGINFECCDAMRD